MSNLIYGTAWKKEQTALLVEEALLCGFKAIDTACQPKHYREDLVGIGISEALKKGIKREDLFIQTKFTPINGQDLDNMPYLKDDDILTCVQKSLETSLENLDVKYLDSYLIHSPFAPIEDFLAVYKKMEEFVDDGTVIQLGVSNCYDLDLFIHLYDNAEVKPKVLQNRFYKESNYDKDLREFCKQKDITYQSFWSLTANPRILSSPELQELTQKYNKTAPQIFYRFLNHLGITPLNGTTSKKHMLEDLQISSFELENDDINKILKLLD